jgi:hypothetical protein
MRYWNCEGKYQEQIDEMVDFYVPSSGKCGVIGGELLRAAIRLHYDGYNNGWCNNTSGAWHFLNKFGNDSIRESIKCLEGCTNTGDYYFFDEGDEVDLALDNLFDVLYEYLDANPSLLSQETDESIFDYQDDTVYVEEEWVE